MIPSATEVVEGWYFVSRRLADVAGPVNPTAVEAALAHARELATNQREEPAALFYAFGCRPRIFPGGWRVMPALLAANQAAGMGLMLAATPEETDAVRRHLAAASRPSFAQVSEWFGRHLRPRE